MGKGAIVPDNVRSLYRPEQVATYLDYSPSTHPRALDPSADAQRILDGVINSGMKGVPERVAYDGGFRVGTGNPKLPENQQAVRVSHVLEATAAAYTGKGDKKTAAQILSAEGLYQSAVKSYWTGVNKTPADVVTRDRNKGETLLGPNGRPIPKAAGQ